MAKASAARRARKLAVKGENVEQVVKMPAEMLTIGRMRVKDLQIAQLALKGAQDKLNEFTNEVATIFSDGGKFEVIGISSDTGEVRRRPLPAAAAPPAEKAEAGE